MSRLGEELKAARIEQSLEQYYVAEKVGITPQYLCDLEKDRRAPSDEILEKLCSTLDVNRNYAYYLIGKFPPEIRDLDIPLSVLDNALTYIYERRNVRG